jgi:hypothetical protein
VRVRDLDEMCESVGECVKIVRDLDTGSENVVAGE